MGIQSTRGFSRLDICDISRVANTNISSIFNYMSWNYGMIVYHRILHDTTIVYHTIRQLLYSFEFSGYAWWFRFPIWVDPSWHAAHSTAISVGNATVPFAHSTADFSIYILFWCLGRLKTSAGQGKLNGLHIILYLHPIILVETSRWSTPTRLAYEDMLHWHCNLTIAHGISWVRCWEPWLKSVDLRGS